MFHQKAVPFFIQENSSRNIVSLDFVDTLEKAQELIRKTIYAPATGEEIESDQGILSYKVYDSDERLIGVIIDTIESHAQDVIVVQSDDKEVMIPFVEEFIIEFNPDKKRIIMELPEGLLDL
jgi:16S rRNA processing protein RimM